MNSRPTCLKIRHETRYSFSEPAHYGLQQLRKTPKSTRQQNVLTWSTSVMGGVEELSFDDHNRNRVVLIRFERDTTELVIVSNGVVEVSDDTGIVGKHQGPAPLWYYLRETPLTRAGRAIRALARQADGDDALSKLHTLSGIVREAVRYEAGLIHPDWTAEQAVAEGVGVCQDHAHVFLAATRSLDLPARYVSGYLMLDDRSAQDAMHAWAEVHVEGLGWVGFDVSNAISPDTRYVRVATGLDYNEAAPVTGMRSGPGEETLTVEIDVAQQ